MTDTNQGQTDPNADDYIKSANGEEHDQSQSGSVNPENSTTPAKPEEGVKDSGIQTDQSENSDGSENTDEKNNSADSEGVKDKEKKPNRATERIRQLVKEKNEFESKIRELESKLANKTAPNEPDIDKFDDPKEYAKAYSQWEKQKTESEKVFSPTVIPHAVQSAVEIIGEDLRGNPEFSDYQTVVTGGDPYMSDTMIEAAAETENPGKIAYHLAQNRKLGQEIMSLSPTAQIMRISHLSNQLINSATKKPNIKTTQAPPPVKSLKGSGGNQINPANLSTGDYIEAMNKAERG